MTMPSLWSLLYALLVFDAGQCHQRFDGWYNNLENPTWGSREDEISHKSPPAYADMTYQLLKENQPNARHISNEVFSGESGMPSYRNQTVLTVFFGQMLAYEIVHASDSSCPVEQLRVPLANEDHEFDSSSEEESNLPFTRSEYMQNTGKSPSNPRKPINKASSWIDASFLYGTNEVWSNYLRSFVGGKLQTLNDTWQFPGKNSIRLPLENLPNPVTESFTKREDLWMFGDVHSHQNPGLAVNALIWFRYHNIVAEGIYREHPDWSDYKIFHRTRSLVIGTLQNIAFYEWLPGFLGISMTEYRGYNSEIKPTVNTMFEAAAFRLGHSQVPPGMYVRDKHCDFKKTKHGKAIRLCNSYWLSQDVINKYGFEQILLGMLSQLAEREDHVIVHDLRGKSFGPLHFSRHDLCVLSIMRGRDHGLPDYNTARKVWGLPPVEHWKDINPWLYQQHPDVFDRLRRACNDSMDTIDLYPAGMLESTPSGPGPLFTAIILDQFSRIRDSDRYWFENENHPTLTKQDKEMIKTIRFKDVILAVTGLEDKDVQDEVFFWRDGDPCPQPKQLQERDMVKCTPHKGFDYFNGSELSYITAFTCLAVIPFICILIAYAIARFKIASTNKTSWFWKRSRRVGSFVPGTFAHVQEWVHKTMPTKKLSLSVDSEKGVVRLGQTNEGRSHQVVDLLKQGTITVFTSSDKRDNILMLRRRDHSDLVFLFSSNRSLDRILMLLNDLFVLHGVDHQHIQNTSKNILDSANTKIKLHEKLHEFLRQAFLHVNHSNGRDSLNHTQFDECEDLANIDISREEFAEAISMKEDSFFVNNMFSVMDKDDNGLISFRELFYVILLFTQGSCDEKLRLLFQMYDTNHSGSLCQEEVYRMMKSLFEMAHLKPNEDELNNMLEVMYKASGLERCDILNYEQFRHFLGDDIDMLWDVSLDTRENEYNRVNKCNKAKQAPGKQQEKQTKYDFVAKTHDPRSVSTCKSWIRPIQRYLENKRQHIAYTFVFVSACVLVFVERVYSYAIEQEHLGLRSIAGYGVSLTRGAAAGMSFTFSLLLLTMCRNTITKLRETVINQYVPFDSSIAFHKIVAYVALIFTLLHIIGYCFNFYHVATQPVQSLCVFEEIFFRSDFYPRVDFWLFCNITGMTGILLVLVVCIVYIFATSVARTHIFNTFWLTHQLVYVLYILMILHGAARVIQTPYFPYYFLGPALIYAADKVVSLSRSKREISINRAEVLPSGVTFIEFKRPQNMTYASGQWVRLACSALGSDEYHSLTLTSAPHEDSLSVHVRAVGPWTRNLKRVFDPDNLRDQPYPKLFIDGPFGAGQQDWFRYEVAVMVGGGIGVTPYASILKDFVFMTSIHSTFKLKCKKVYFIWVTNSHRQFEWFLDILEQVEAVDSQGLVDVHIFITQLAHMFDLRTTLLYICEENFKRIAGRSSFTNLKAATHFGRPDFMKVFQAISLKHPKHRRVGVFSCGPPGLTKGIKKACQEASMKTKTQFEHHFENF